ncbi:MAG TPA: hydroxyacid dehydrogenase [Bacillaceae bacterium]|nr:hydroxyacid dehydrogenase [Bacillaceae bacterium]
MKIIITEFNWPSGNQLLQEKGWQVVYDPELWTNREKLQSELKDADAIIVRNQTKVDVELIQAAPRLKVIGRLGVGLDNIDLEATAQRGIVTVFGKNANATSVAEYVIGSIFQFSRKIRDASHDVKAGGWNRKAFTGVELFGKTLGLIGVGEISHRVAIRAKALGMNIIGYDPFVAPYDFPVMESGIELMEYEAVVQNADFLSLHVPLTRGTKNLINEHILHRMKSTSIIINSSRGGIINEFDLFHALKNNKIAGAILDVLEDEPPNENHPLLTLENCIITPHIAGLTEESQSRTSELVSKAVISELEGKVSLCRV